MKRKTHPSPKKSPIEIPSHQTLSFSVSWLWTPLITHSLDFLRLFCIKTKETKNIIWNEIPATPPQFNPPLQTTPSVRRSHFWHLTYPGFRFAPPEANHIPLLRSVLKTKKLNFNRSPSLRIPKAFGKERGGQGVSSKTNWSGLATKKWTIIPSPSGQHINSTGCSVAKPGVRNSLSPIHRAERFFEVPTKLRR